MLSGATPPEWNVFETLRCPSCSSRYGLKPERVRPGIRRAHCFRCQTVFGIEIEVERLLAIPVAPEPPAFQLPPPIEEAPTQETLPLPEDLAMEELAIGPDDLTDLMAEEAAEESTVKPIVEPEPEIQAKQPQIPPADELPPSLTLGDLEGSEDEILEKTLLVAPPEVTEPPPPPSAFKAEPTATGGYASARDAISKLLGDVPAAQGSPLERRTTSRTSNQMDVEAALDALDTTLGGTTRNQDLGTTPGIVPPEFAHPVPAARHADDQERFTATTKLSHEELMVAMAAAAKPVAPVPPPVVTPPPPVPVIQRPAPLLPEPHPADSSLYKVQLPKETAQNLSIETILTWIEQGHIQEYHMVARQQSEHWIEASKVPAMRMAFDRLRRTQAIGTPQEMTQPSPSETAPLKRGLFGGFFGRS